MGIDFGAPTGLIPRAGSPAADQLRDKFYSDMLALLGDAKLLWVPEPTETTTSTDRSRHAATLTYSKDVTTFDDGPEVQGSGTVVTFDGTDEEADTPDNDRLSFGDGAVDQPFSIVALINPGAVASNTIISKYDPTTGTTKREWSFNIDGNGYPEVEIWDDSAAAKIGREDQTALTVDTWTLLVMTYDGSAANTGIRIYKDGAQVDDANNTTGTYVAMENTSTKVMLAHRLATNSAVALLYDGKMAMAAVTGKQLSATDVWSIKERVNAFFDLEL